MLLESVMAIAVITVVMTALTTFFVTTMSSTAHLRARQGAIQIASSAMELVHGVGAVGASAGRSPASVDAQWGTKQATTDPVKSWLTSMGPAADPGSSTSPTLPTTPESRNFNGLNYNVNYYVGWCLKPVEYTAAPTSCGPNTVGGYGETKNYTQYLRAVVAVTWTDKSCPGTKCTYLTASLLNGSIDPTYNYNSPPPPPPVLQHCQTLASLVGDVVNRDILAVGSAPGCDPPGGVPPLTYRATGLPRELTMNATTGKVTGTVTGDAAPLTVTFTVAATDGFLRESNPVKFTWKIYPALAITSPPAGSVQKNNTGDQVNLTALASGGSGAPYLWAATGLPVGLTIDPASGVISGVPTMKGANAVTLTVTDDPTGASKQVTFTWNITLPPLAVAKPSPQKTTQTATVAPLQIVASGGSRKYSFGPSTLPDGLTLNSTTGKITGKVTSAAKEFSATVTVRDTDSTQEITVTFPWTVYAPPTLTPPSTQTTLGDQAVKLPVAATCPNNPCTYTSNGLPTWLRLDPATGDLTGTAPNKALSANGITVTVTDAANVSRTTPPFTWNVVTKLAVVVSDQTFRYNQISIPLAAFVTGGIGGKENFVYQITGNYPATLSVNGNVFSGHTSFPFFYRDYDGLVLTVTDMTGATVSSAPFTLRVTW